MLITKAFLLLIIAAKKWLLQVLLLGYKISCKAALTGLYLREKKL